MNKKYLSYLFKSRRVTVLFFGLLYLAGMLVPYVTQDRYYYPYNSSVPVVNEMFDEVTLIGYVLSLILVFVLPVILFAFVHTRRSADQYFALPYTRQEQLITNALFAYLMSFGYFLVGMLIAYIYQGHLELGLTSFLAIIIEAAFTLLVVLVVNIAIYLIANNVLDGIVMIGSYAFFPLFVSIVLAIFLSNILPWSTSDIWDIFPIAQYLSPVYLAFENIYGLLPYEDGISISYQLALAVYLCIGIYGLYRGFILRKTERAEQVSDQILAYPFVINIYLAMSLLALGSYWVKNRDMDLIILYLILLFVYIVAMFVYRRKVKITARPLIIFASGTAISLLISMAAWGTHCFGIADRYDWKRDQYIYFSYNTTVDFEDLGEVWRTDYSYTNGKYETNVSLAGFIDTTDEEVYNALIPVVESFRSEGIEAFYRIGEDSYTPTYATFYTTNLNDHRYNNESRHQRQSYTWLESSISEEDLKKFEEAGFEVEIYIYEWNQGTSAEYTLSEFLEARENDEIILK